MRTIYILLFLIIFSVQLPAREKVSIYGKADYRTIVYENVIGTAIDSVAGSSIIDVDYEVRVLSVSGNNYRCQYRNLISEINTQYYIIPSTQDSTHIEGLTIYYDSSIAVGDRFVFSCDTDLPVALDSLGGIYDAFYTYIKNDTIHAITSIPDTVLFSGDYDKGLTIFSQQNIK